MKILSLLLICFIISGCAHNSVPPQKNPPPVVNLGSMHEHISGVDKAVKNAKSRADRIEILIDAIQVE